MEAPRTRRMRKLAGSASPAWRIMPSGRLQRPFSRTKSSFQAPGPAAASTSISETVAISPYIRRYGKPRRQTP